MKKILMSLIILNCSFANAYEYSSDYDDRRYEREREEWHESNSRHATPPRYQQNYQQPPIQIFLSPDMNNYYQRDNRRNYRKHYNDRNYDKRRYQEERYLLQQRELLRQIQPYENQFYRDDTHW